MDQLISYYEVLIASPEPQPTAGSPFFLIHAWTSVGIYLRSPVFFPPRLYPIFEEGGMHPRKRKRERKRIIIGFHQMMKAVAKRPRSAINR